MFVDIFKTRWACKRVEKRRSKKKERLKKKGNKRKREMIIVAKRSFIGGLDLHERGGLDMDAANAIVSLYRCISTRFIALNYN